jgi:hypothetical protein
LSELFNAFGNFTVKTPQFWEFHGKFVGISWEIRVNSRKIEEKTIQMGYSTVKI